MFWISIDCRLVGCLTKRQVIVSRVGIVESKNMQSYITSVILFSFGYEMRVNHNMSDFHTDDRKPSPSPRGCKTAISNDYTS